MKPFLLLGVRPEQAAADDEYAAFARFTGLGTDLQRHPVDREPFSRDPRDYAGIIIGGSPFNVSDTDKSPNQQRVEDDLNRVVDVALEQRIPLLGACYGLGLIARHEGGAVDAEFGEQIAAVPVSLTDAGRADPVFGGLPEVFNAIVGHKEAVSTPPPDSVVLAGSPGAPVQALRVGRAAYATQFHPELDADGLLVRMTTYRDAGHFDPQEADAIMALARNTDVTHPPQILRRFVAFARSFSPA
ncbi:glutamine amidotransferase [Branchiibius cervicis]|uniref:Glutamine amidotransferase n=1 Tax=Branchiibius cervicis TaxID=908252 RepID=A0ABW2ARN9_9MICO